MQRDLDTFNPAYIEIAAGTVTASTISDHRGTRPVFEDIGQFHFFVTLFETDGTQLGLWSGEDYDAAIREAERSRIDFEIAAPVRDTVAGGGHE